MIYLILSCLIVIVSLGAAHVEAAPPQGAKWQQVFHDDFEGSQLNTNHWTKQYPWGRTNAGNHEGQYYLDTLAYTQNGQLTLRADKNNPDIYPPIDDKQPSFPYVSGMVTTNNKHIFKYGYFEIKATLPKGKGIWPAFWLHKSDPKGWLPEIDVLEFLGHETNRVHMTNHFEKQGVHHEQTCAYLGNDFTQGPHTFGVWWKPDALIYYVDGVERCRFLSEVPSEPMYLILNLAVGADWPGYPDDSTQFPQTFTIDHVRVYKEL